MLNEETKKENNTAIATLSIRATVAGMATVVDCGLQVAEAKVTMHVHNSFLLNTYYVWLAYYTAN